MIQTMWGNFAPHDKQISCLQTHSYKIINIVKKLLWQVFLVTSFFALSFSENGCSGKIYVDDHYHCYEILHCGRWSRGKVKRPKRPSHMGHEGDSYETKSPMANFLIFGMVWVVGITTQNFKTGLLQEFEKTCVLYIAMVKKPLSSGQKWFLRRVFPGLGGYFYWWKRLPWHRKCASLNTTQLKSNRCHFQDIALLAFLRKMRKLRNFVWWFPPAIGDFVW